MCTSVAFNIGKFYFGRNMDLEGSFGERVVVAPRNFAFAYRQEPTVTHHYAMIGMAAVVSGYPLFADAMNEKGLCMAGLNFPGNAVYAKRPRTGKANVTPFELIPWVLGKCATADEAEQLLRETELVAIPFSENYPLTPLHWHIADKQQSLTVEPMAEGLKIYKNPVGVLTNNPPFPYHTANLARYANLGTGTPDGDWMWEAGAVSFGLCGMGLPGDYSSASRFVRAAFLKKHLLVGETTDETVASAFQLLGAVAPTKGSVLTPEGNPHYTTYTCCMNAEQGIYYYKRHGDLYLQQVQMCDNLLDGNALVL